MKLKLNKYIVSYILLLIIFIIPIFLFKPFVDLNYSDYMGYNNVFEDANSIYKMFIITAFILLLVIVLSINNLKEIKTKKKLFVLNTLPLLLILLISFVFLTIIALDYQGFQKNLIYPPCEPMKPCGTPLDYVQAYNNIINFLLYYLFIYHAILLSYGIYYFRKIDNVFGFKVIKFNMSILVSIVLINILLVLT